MVCRKVNSIEGAEFGEGGASLIGGARFSEGGASLGEEGGGEGDVELAGGAERGVNDTARTEWLVAGVRMVGRWRMEAWKRQLNGILHSELRWPNRRQRRQRIGSRQSCTRWSEAKQRKQTVVGEKGF